VNWSGCEFIGQNLSGVNLSGANLAGADLTGADFTGADLTGADLTGSTLNQATVAKAKLGGAKFQGASVVGLQSGGLAIQTIGDLGSAPSDAWSVIGGYLVGPAANLDGASLIGAKLTGANLTSVTLTGADLTGATSGGIIGSPATLPTKWKAAGGFLVGPGADLSSASFRNIDVTGMDFATVTMKRIRTSGLTGSPATLPKGWVFTNSYLVGPWSDLRGAQLQRANLSNANLSNLLATSAKFSYGDMTGADLTDGNFAGAILSSVLMMDAKVNSGTNFSGTFLKGTHDLSPGATYSSTTTCSNGMRYGQGGDCPE